MIDDRRAGPPPHAPILVAVVLAVLLIPTFLGEQGEAVTGFFEELLTPVGLLLLPILILLAIHFLSSDRGYFVSAIFTGEPNSIHRLNGSPIGVALFLVLVLLLLYSKLSVFGGNPDSGN